MKSKCNETVLEQLYVTKTIDPKELVQYALKLGISCQKLNHFILSEQYKNNIIMNNLFNKIIHFQLDKASKGDTGCYKIEDAVK